MQNIREIILTKRANISPYTRKLLATSTLENIQKDIIFQSCSLHNIAVFLSMKDECPTQDLIKWLFSMDKFCLSVPVITNMKQGLMAFVNYDATTSLIKNKYGILEPKLKQFLTNKLIFDLIIVPLVAFDDSGNRLGMGGGFYDRFLAQQPTAKKIGWCFECQHVKKLESMPWDIKLDAIATDKRLSQFN